MPPERKRRKMSLEGEDLSAAKPERGRLRGTLGAGTAKQEEKGSSGNGRWAGDPERGRWYGTLRALNRKPMVNNVQPKYRNTLHGTYSGDQYDASGRQRGTLILSCRRRQVSFGRGVWKGTQGSVLAWRAASLLLGRLLLLY